MSLVNLVFGIGNARTQIGTLELDALLEETVTLTSKVTKYVVEDGAPITDHISNENEKLHIEGIVTSATVVLRGEAGRQKLINAKEALRLLHEQRTPITVITGMDMYVDFAIESCDIGRNVDDGECLTVSLELSHIRKATVETTDVPEGKVKAANKGKAGETKKKGGKVTNTKSKSSTVSKAAKSKTTPSPKGADKAQAVASADKAAQTSQKAGKTMRPTSKASQAFGWGR